MSSQLFGSKKRPAGKQYRDGVLGKALDEVYTDVDSAFAALETALQGGGGGGGGSSPKVAATATVGAYIPFEEGTNNGTNKVTLKAANSLAGDVVATLPSSTGTLALVADIPAAVKTPATNTVGAHVTFEEGTDHGVNKVTVKAADDISADTVATLPAVTGTLCCAVIGNVTISGTNAAAAPIAIPDNFMPIFGIAARSAGCASRFVTAEIAGGNITFTLDAAPGAGTPDETAMITYAFIGV